MDFELDKYGQSVAIWVIIGIAFVASMILFFTVNQGIKFGGEDRDFAPESFIGSCVESVVQESVDRMLLTGGFIDNNASILFEGDKVSYLCYTRGNYERCVNQHPVYLEELKEEIIKNSEEGIDSCFEKMREEVESRGGTVTLGIMNLDVGLTSKRIFLTINRDINMRIAEENKKTEKINVDIINPLKSLVLVAIEITGQEANNCYFEYVGYNLLHPEIGVRATSLIDGTTVYGVKDKSSGKELKFAVRGCVIPPGIPVPSQE